MLSKYDWVWLGGYLGVLVQTSARNLLRGTGDRGTCTGEFGTHSNICAGAFLQRRSIIDIGPGS